MSALTNSATLSEHVRIALLPIVKEDLKVKDDHDDLKLLEDINLTAETLLGDVAEYADEDDILQNQKLLSLAEETVRLFVMYKYKRRNNNSDAAKDYKEDYRHSAQSLIKKARQLRTDRSQKLLISKDPRDIKTVLPTQSGIFAFDDF